MHLFRVHRTSTKFKIVLKRHYSQVSALEKSEYADVAQYPPITDNTIQGRKRRDREILRNKIKNINTVEEKQIALNMPRYYGWRCTMFIDNIVPYNAMPMIKCYTRSHFINTDNLPEVYAENKSQAEEIVKDIKSQICEALAIEHEGIANNLPIPKNAIEKQNLEDKKTKKIVQHINRIISNNLADKVAHILPMQVDYDPRHEAFWFVGGLRPPQKVVNWRKQYKWLSTRLYEPIEKPVQYLGNPLLALRNRLPLKPIIPYSEAENPDFKVEKFDYDPVTVGYYIDHRFGTNIPGFWPGDYDEFGIMSYHGSGHLENRPKSFGEGDNLEALHCQAIKASFGWLLAQANHLGFTTYNDITYPLTTQTIITNGQMWSLYAYQLNTIEMHNDAMDSNPKHNVCFGMKPQKLYDTIENGEVKGLNDDLLTMLVQIYMNTPEEREYEIKPYLNENEPYIAHIEDDNKRAWLENTYKHLMSNRPRHYLLPETYHWEKIYKIENNTRFFEKKVRPFELGINPYKRKLNEHLPPYIPKVLRPYPRARKKFETTYYPDV